jgi:hypothetical protein
MRNLNEEMPSSKSAEEPKNSPADTGANGPRYLCEFLVAPVFLLLAQLSVKIINGISTKKALQYYNNSVILEPVSYKNY